MALAEGMSRVEARGATVDRGVADGRVAVGCAEAVFSRLPASTVIASTVGRYSVG
jgi:hypothetical protein